MAGGRTIATVPICLESVFTF